MSGPSLSGQVVTLHGVTCDPMLWLECPAQQGGVSFSEDGKLAIYDGDYRSYMEQNEDTQSKVEARYIPGLTRIQSAPKIEIQPEETQKKAKKKKSFGGRGGPSGNKMKGVKNAKRQGAAL